MQNEDIENKEVVELFEKLKRLPADERRVIPWVYRNRKTVESCCALFNLTKEECLEQIDFASKKNDHYMVMILCYYMAMKFPEYNLDFGNPDEITSTQ